MVVDHASIATWIVAAAATAGVIVRPFKWPEAVWACAGALLLLAFGLLSPADEWRAIGKGLDVYLFLIGMMLLSEIARREGLFDFAAALAVNLAAGSQARLFALIYGVGVVVTTFLSNDATAVVLTPAVFAVARKAKAEPLPLLFACALVANAASFILPISNPANLVLYAGHTPPLATWFGSFALPSLAAVMATYAVLMHVERQRIQGECVRRVEPPPLTGGGWTALIGIVVTAIALLVVSAVDAPLGLPTCVLGVVTATTVLARQRRSPIPVFKAVSWSVLPLVAGLFVLVEGLARTGFVSALASLLQRASQASASATAAGSGGAIAVAANLMNNLPAGLVASSTLAQANPPKPVVDALLIGVDLGPNLSITGSLATILWLTALRREGLTVGFWQFLKVGALAMPPALILAIGARLALR